LPWEKWLQGGAPLSDFSPTFFVFQAMTHIFSPYHINPFNLNPLKEALAEVVDFSRLTKCNKAPRLFLSATNVRTGKIKVFENDAVSVDVVLASATFSMLSKSMGSTIGTAGSWAIPQSFHWFTIAVPKT
jgi:NTE family protein